jgi:hypothetical protein
MHGRVGREEESMSEYQGQAGQAQGSVESEAKDVSSWTAGFIVFAALMMMLVGVFHALVGLIGVLDDDFYVVREGYELKIDIAAWGWFHMIGGSVIVVAGWYLLLTGSLWARLIAILVVSISMIWNFVSIPYYPVWSILLIAIDGAILWAIIAHGAEYERFARERDASEGMSGPNSSRFY